jgi:hypothetical protein
MRHTGDADELLELASDELRPVVRGDARLCLRVFLLGSFQDYLDVGPPHRLTQIPVHDLLQELNPFLLLFHPAVGTLLSLKGGRSVLEELLLPAIEHRWPQAQFFTRVRDRRLIQRCRLKTPTFSSAQYCFRSFLIRSLRDPNGGTLLSISSCGRTHGGPGPC